MIPTNEFRVLGCFDPVLSVKTIRPRLRVRSAFINGKKRFYRRFLLKQKTKNN
jgi:hypothetical protein